MHLIEINQKSLLNMSWPYVKIQSGSMKLFTIKFVMAHKKYKNKHKCNIHHSSHQNIFDYTENFLKSGKKMK